MSAIINDYLGEFPMPVIFLPGSDEPNDFTEGLKDKSLQELIDAYN